MDDGILTIERNYETKLSLFDVSRSVFIGKDANMVESNDDKILFDNEDEALRFMEGMDTDDPFPVATDFIIVKVIVEK